MANYNCRNKKRSILQQVGMLDSGGGRGGGTGKLFIKFIKIQLGIYSSQEFTLLMNRWVYFSWWWIISPPFLQCSEEAACTSHIQKSTLGIWIVILVWRKYGSQETALTHRDHNCTKLQCIPDDFGSSKGFHWLQKIRMIQVPSAPSRWTLYCCHYSHKRPLGATLDPGTRGRTALVWLVPLPEDPAGKQSSQCQWDVV